MILFVPFKSAFHRLVFQRSRYKKLALAIKVKEGKRGRVVCLPFLFKRLVNQYLPLVIKMRTGEKKIHFATKAENNRRREAEFLALSPSERLQSFLRSFDSDLFSQFIDPKELGENKGNFCIYKNEV